MKNSNLFAKKSGFTIVELLVVIAVIGILTAIITVSYIGVTSKAVSASLQSDLTNVKGDILIFQAEKGVFPVTINDCPNPASNNICFSKYSPGNTYTYYQADNTSSPKTFCLTATNDDMSQRISQNSVPSKGSCLDFYAWTISGGMLYDDSTDQISLISSGYASSPLIRVDNSSSVTLDTESYATKVSPSFSTQGGVYFSSNYYKADGVTPALNSSGYTGNGNAQAIPLSIWTKRTWQTPTGPNVVYVRFLINSSPTNYTSDNLFRTPIITYR